MNKVYTLTHELRGELYMAVLALAERYYCQALLVIRQSEPLSSIADSVLATLRTYEIHREMAAEWPGTVLHSGKAMVIWYKLVPESRAVLVEVTDGLYGWLHPNLPEDLCLIRPGGDPWLVSIAHEKDSYFELSDEEYDDLVKTIPSIKDCLRR